MNVSTDWDLVQITILFNFQRGLQDRIVLSVECQPSPRLPRGRLVSYGLLSIYVCHMTTLRLNIKEKICRFSLERKCIKHEFEFQCQDVFSDQIIFS